MSTPRTAYVGVKHGELAITIGPSEVVLGVDLSVPGVSPFVIKSDLSTSSGEDREVLFGEMLEALVCLIKTYFEAQGFDPAALEDLRTRMAGAVESLGNTHASVVPGYEDPESYFEASFEMPDLFLEQTHTKVVLAAVPVIRRTPTKPPAPVRTAPQTRIVQRPQQSLRNLVTRFKQQQNKPLSGPLYVLVYDTWGRPVGVRSIKGPGWTGVGGGGKIASTSRVTAVAEVLPVEARTRVQRLTRLITAREHGAVVGAMIYTELPTERRILDVEAPGAHPHILAALRESLGTMKPITGW